MTHDTTATLIGEVHELRAENEALKIEVESWKGKSCPGVCLKYDEAERLKGIAHGLARALHRCSAFLPLFIEEGPKLRRAMAADDQAHAAIDAYCSHFDLRPVDLCEVTR